ncbi:MAG: hypothetical protein ACFB5Z_01860 [Elainellaceae cyanobacterium]
MNPWRKLGDIASTLFAVFLVAWFTAQCVKFGWYARGNPLLRPIVANLLGLDPEPAEPSALERLRELVNPDGEDVTP